jgi:hypothetical protein
MRAPAADVTAAFLQQTRHSPVTRAIEDAREDKSTQEIQGVTL